MNRSVIMGRVSRLSGIVVFSVKRTGWETRFTVARGQIVSSSLAFRLLRFVSKCQCCNDLWQMSIIFKYTLVKNAIFFRMTPVEIA